MGFKALVIAAASMFLGAQDIDSQSVSGAAELTYADLADLALAAPIAAHVRIRDADRLPRELAATAPPGHRRYLVEADVVALIRGAGGLPERVRYLIDLPDDSAARPRRRSEWLILAERPTGQPAGELRLVATDAQLPYAPGTAERLREVLREASQPGAPPRITGIGRAFHVPGSLPGESETQIFLQTADNRPISLTILRRPNQIPRWSVALSEIVDEAAAAPARDTLLWYRLACTLPPALPRESVREAGADEARAIVADYRLVREGLGTCDRDRRPR